MKKRYFLPVGFLILFFGCYGIDNRESLNIVLNYHNISGTYFGKYIDSVYNKDVPIPDSISEKLIGYDNELISTERIIFIKRDDIGNPDEYFLINLFGRPCVIEGMYNVTLSEDAIYKKSQLNEEEIARIKGRFKKEVLSKSEDYALINKLPDSIIYDTRDVN